MRLYLDEDLSPRIAEILRGRGIDAASAYEEGNTMWDDAAQLRHATAQGRAIVTGNVQDFIAQDLAALAANTAHAGIVLVPGTFRRGDFGALADALERLARLYPAGIPQTVLYLRRGP